MVKMMLIGGMLVELMDGVWGLGMCIIKLIVWEVCFVIILKRYFVFWIS